MEADRPPAPVKDPVCGMDVIPGEAAGGSAEHAGTTYWFCSLRCREITCADDSSLVANTDFAADLA